MKTRIVVDSTADILPEYLDQIHTVPLTVSFGEEEYIDGVTIDHRTFYQKLIETDAMPSTSQASPAAFAEQYDQAAAADEEVVVITISSKLSGTYQSAMIAAAGCSSVYVVDSENASVGCGILVGLALRYLRDGMTASAIAEKLQEDKKKIVVIAVLDTLEYLKRGGRISKAAAFAGGLLNIKPVISIADGEIQLLGKARGSKMGNNLLAQQIQKVGGIDFTKPVLLGYTGLSDVLLQKYIEDSSYLWSASLDAVRYVSIGSVIGAHAGPGAIAVAFFRNRRLEKHLFAFSMMNHLIQNPIKRQSGRQALFDNNACPLLFALIGICFKTVSVLGFSTFTHLMDQFDAVLVLKDGQLTEAGTFRELMAKQGTCYNLVNKLTL